MEKLSIFWFRRDLRLFDNAGLYHALKSGGQVMPLFILDTDILDQLPNKQDKRVDFILRCLRNLQEVLEEHGSSLTVLIGKPLEIFAQLIEQHPIAAVYTNHDYEPYARARDEKVQQLLAAKGVGFHTFKDQVIFERDEVMKDDGTPYTVFTPYSKKWRLKLHSFALEPYPAEAYMHRLRQMQPLAVPTLRDIGFEETGLNISDPIMDRDIAGSYDKTRDYPAKSGTTRLSMHLRFGTVSVRDLAKQALELNSTLLNEFIWREFYMMILWHFPHVVGGAFKPDYDKIVWRNNEQEFEAWCMGKTGVPIVDAGMRELNETGFMHNRVRMITASFLTKNLLIDWRWGEAYFAEKLLDFDLSANNGGWQWAAGSGCDAAPYFRIFSPQLQTEKFDPKLEYVRKWVPEYEQLTYTRPIVDIKASRERCINAYKQALGR